LLVLLVAPGRSLADATAPRALQRSAAGGLIVNALGDQGCDFWGCPACDGTGTCTLRQAIQKANGMPDPNLEIHFSADLVGGVITVNSPMPTITRSGLWLLGTDPVGNQIDLEIQVQPGADWFLRVNADDVRIALLRIVRQMATSGGTTSAIYVEGGRNVLIDYNQIGGAFIRGENDMVPTCFSNRVEAGAIGILVRNTVSAADNNLRILKNTIGCMESGIVLSGADYVSIGRDPTLPAPQQGNSIGIEPRMGQPIPNNRGILIANYLPVPGSPSEGAAVANTIAHNTVAHNLTAGILLDGAAPSWIVGYNQIYDNHVYANQSGIVLRGIAWNNQVGVACTGSEANPPCGGNRIYDNLDSGVRIGEGYVRENTIYGNFIGTADGVTARPNGRGIYVFGDSHDTRIEQNVISGNTGDGIRVEGTAAAPYPVSVIQNNDIGLTSNLMAALPNGGSGVTVAGVTRQMQIVTNIIAGNSQRGVQLDGAGVMTNTVSQNSLGYATGATGIGNGFDGLLLTHDANNNRIEQNSIRFNGYSGIAFSAGHTNSASNNFIADNAFYGALFVGAATANNQMSGDTITRNGADGIGSRSGAGNNVWRPAAVYDNGGLGIDRNADSDSTNQPTDPLPMITRVAPISSGYVIFGSVPAASGGRTWTVDLYRVAFDPSGYGEGREKVGTVTGVDGGSGWQWVRSDTAAGNKGCYTAIMTLVEGGSRLYTSEFSRIACGNRLNLPLIVRP